MANRAVATFPHHTCFRMALTPAGLRALGLSLEDLEEALGYPRGWMEAGSAINYEQRLRLLRESVDGVDFSAIRRLANWRPPTPKPLETPSSVLSEQILRNLVRQLEGPQRYVSTPDLAAELIYGDDPDRDAENV